MMRIVVSEYKLVLSEDELWTLVHAISFKIVSGAEHAARHTGWNTIVYNYKDLIEMHEQISTRLGRPDLHDSMIEKTEQEILRYSKEIVLESS